MHMRYAYIHALSQKEDQAWSIVCTQQTYQQNIGENFEEALRTFIYLCATYFLFIFVINIIAWDKTNYNVIKCDPAL